MNKNIKHWDSYAKIKKDSLMGAHSDWHIVELENKFIKEVLLKIKPKRLLDIGCGNGQRTLLFSNFVTQKVLGLDYSKNMISEAETILSKQNNRIKKKISFNHSNIFDFKDNIKFNIIISCRCFVNQASTKNQIKLFKKLYENLLIGGSLVIAEQSKEGLERINKLRKSFNLKPIKIPWHNLPLEEKKIFPEIKSLFKINRLIRLETFYYISRVIHPALVFPENPNPNAKINDIAMKAEIMSQQKENLGIKSLLNISPHLLIHLKKIK